MSVRAGYRQCLLDIAWHLATVSVVNNSHTHKINREYNDCWHILSVWIKSHQWHDTLIVAQCILLPAWYPQQPSTRSHTRVYFHMLSLAVLYTISSNVSAFFATMPYLRWLTATLKIKICVNKRTQKVLFHLDIFSRDECEEALLFLPLHVKAIV